MKALRILQVVLLLLVLSYLLVLHNENPYNVLLPFLPNLPAAVTIALALLLGWLIGWLPTKMRMWRVKRERDQLSRELRRLRGEPDATSTTAAVTPARDASPHRVRAAGPDGSGRQV